MPRGWRSAAPCCASRRRWTMSDRREAPEDVAIRVADGQAVDWDEALKSASDDAERRIIRQLGLIESVARFHGSGSLEQTVVADVRRVPGVSLTGGTWGHLELRQKLGEGSFGEVYRAWDPRLDREVALKLLKVEQSAEQALASQVVEEGRLMAKLRDPHVVTVFGA